MKLSRYTSIVWAVLIPTAVVSWSAAAPIEIAAIQRDSDVDFEKEILPIFRRNCLACHSATEAQGDLVLESPQTILKGGSEGPAVVAGKSSESRLLKLASQQKEPLMPPPDNDVKAKPLTPQELGLIKLWIDQGAKGEIKAANAEIAWQLLPPGINPIYAVAITADGQYAAASRANQIFLVHVPSKRELGRLTDPALLSGGIYKQPGVADLDLIQSLKFNPDGTWLASGGFRTVKLWHKTGGQKVADVSEAEAAAAMETPNAKSITPGDKPEEVKVTLGSESKSFNHGSPIASSAISADGKRLVTIGADGSAKLWDVAAAKSLADLKGDLRLSLKARELARAAALAKKHIELAKKDLEDATGRKKAEEENKTKAAEALAKSESELKPKEEATKKAADEKTAADTSLNDATAAKTKSDEAKKAAEDVLTKSDDALKAAKASQEAAAKIDTDEGKAVKLAADKATSEIEALIKLLDSSKQHATKAAEEAATKLADTEKKSKELATAHQKALDDEAVAKRNVDTAKRSVDRANEAVKKATDAIPGFEALVKAAEDAAKTADDAVTKANAAAKDAENPVRAAAFSPDDQRIATVGDDGAIHTWDAASGAAVEAYDTPAPLTGIAFVDPSHVVVIAKSGATKWNVSSEWKLERTIGSPTSDAIFTDRVTALDFSPDGKTLAVGSGEPSRSGQIKLFAVATGEEKLTIKEPHSDTVNCLAFSPDGKELASCAADRFVKLWNVADGKHLRSFEGHTHHVLGLAWRPDGRALVSSGADMVLKVWDARTGEQLRTVQNQFTKEVTSVAFLADDLVLASGGDAKVRAINPTNGNSQRDFAGTSDYMYSVAASADGKTILAGGLDSILRIWNDQGQEIAKFIAPAVASPAKTAAK